MRWDGRPGRRSLLQTEGAAFHPTLAGLENLNEPFFFWLDKHRSGSPGKGRLHVLLARSASRVWDLTVPKPASAWRGASVRQGPYRGDRISTTRDSRRGMASLVAAVSGKTLWSCRVPWWALSALGFSLNELDTLYVAHLLLKLEPAEQ